jgi:SAM-dependent methyltransferase
VCNDEVLAERDRFAISVVTVICKECGLVRINPRLDEGSYARFYDKEYLDIKTLEYYDDPLARVRAIHTEEYEQAIRIHGFLVNTMKVKDLPLLNPAHHWVADVGCGSGGMVQYFSDQGYSAYGCDYDSGSIAYGQSVGQNLVTGGPKVLGALGKFQLVILSHVFEHVTSPFAMLDSVIGIMQPGSVLYIELPGILDISMGRYRNDFLRYLRFVHTFNFSLSTLTNLVESRGFKLVYGDEWIHAVFVYEGKPPQAMRPLLEEYKNISSYLRQIERRRFLYPVFILYTFLRNSVTGMLETLGLKESLKRILRERNR